MGGGTSRSNHKVWPLFCWCHHRRWKKRNSLALQGYGSTPTNSFFPPLRRWQRNLLYLSAQRRIGTMPLCKSMRVYNTSPFLTPDTLAFLWMEHPAEAPVDISAHWKFANSFTQVVRWYSQGGLKGGLEPVWVTLPKLPLCEMGSTSEDTQLQITLPRTTQGDSPEAVPLWPSTPISSPHSITDCPSKVVTGPSPSEEIADLLLNPMSKIPGESSTCNSPCSMAKKEENPPDPGETLQG